MRRARALRLAGGGRRLGPKRSRRILASADKRPSAGASARSSTACAGSACQASSLSIRDGEAGFVATSFIGPPVAALLYPRRYQLVRKVPVRRRLRSTERPTPP